MNLPPAPAAKGSTADPDDLEARMRLQELTELRRGEGSPTDSRGEGAPAPALGTPHRGGLGVGAADPNYP